VCEPTSLDIQPITNGTFLFQLEVEGLEAHTGSKNMIAYPQPYGVPHGGEVGADAIDKMTKFLSAYKDLERRWGFRYRHPLFGSGNDRGGVAPFTITATLIEGGPYAASIPGYCRATFQVYFPPFIKAREAWREIKQTAAAVCMTDDWLSRKPPNLRVTSRIWEPHETPIENEGCKTLIASYENVLNERPRLAGMKAVCDATYLGKKGIPSVVFGPGDLHAGVHGPNESIQISNMVTCCKIYCEMISNWCTIV
jgi:acetylornithine deacetylase